MMFARAGFRTVAIAIMAFGPCAGQVQVQAQPLPAGGAAGVFQARQFPAGLLLTGLGGLVAGGLAIGMAGGASKPGEGQSAVINSSTGTSP